MSMSGTNFIYFCICLVSSISLGGDTARIRGTLARQSSVGSAFDYSDSFDDEIEGSAAAGIAYINKENEAGVPEENKNLSRLQRSCGRSNGNNNTVCWYSGKLEEKGKEIAKLEDRYAQLNDSYYKLKNQPENQSLSQSDINKLKYKKAELENRLKELAGQNKKLIHGGDELQHTITQFDRNNSVLAKDNNDYKTRLSLCADDTSQLLQTIEDREKQMQQIHNNNRKCSNKNSKLNAEISRLKAELVNVTDQIGIIGDDNENLRCRCPDTWQEHQQFCYKAIVTQYSFQEAQYNCQIYNGHLAHEDQDNTDFIRKLWRCISERNAWIGLQRIDGPHWRYTNGSRVQFTSWMPSDGGNKIWNAKCVILKKKGWALKGWQAIRCDQKQASLCQRKKCIDR